MTIGLEHRRRIGKDEIQQLKTEALQNQFIKLLYEKVFNKLFWYCLVCIRLTVSGCRAFHRVKYLQRQVCDSLFAKDKLMLSLLLTFKSMEAGKLEEQKYMNI